ncbi:MAG: lipopolysaccharide kinase InaA family protein [Gammaproteobacteria bacterium]
MNSLTATLNRIKTNDLNILGDNLVTQLTTAGLAGFDQLWDLPHEFVEPPNIRRNGWSGVSIVRLQQRDGEFRSYYLKRQENQARYSLRYLSGAPTFQFEADALQLAMQKKWPCVELGAFGTRTHPSKGASQAILLTPKIEWPCLESYSQSISHWNDYLPQLRLVGEQMLSMHQSGWQHGAFFPIHIFIELSTGKICLIDLERARKRFTPLRAAVSDFTQFFKRCDWLPDDAVSALLAAHTELMPQLIVKLSRRFPNRINLK